MNKEQLAKVRSIVYDAYCEGDTEAEWMLVVIDAALTADPQSKEYLVRDLTGAEIYKLWREHQTSSISSFVRRCFMVASGKNRRSAT